MTQDELFMREAVALSRQAVEKGNEPFGAVLVRNGEIVFRNENQINTRSDPSFHAEAGLIRQYCAEQHTMDLSDCTLYTSCEPCFMCSGAMVWAKLGRLVYAASAPDLLSIFHQEGVSSSRIVFENSGHRPAVTGGVLRDEAMEVLRAYFG